MQLCFEQLTQRTERFAAYIVNSEKCIQQCRDTYSTHAVQRCSQYTCSAEIGMVHSSPLVQYVAPCTTSMPQVQREVSVVQYLSTTISSPFSFSFLSLPLLACTSFPFSYSFLSLPLLAYTSSPFSYSLSSLPLFTCTSSSVSYSLLLLPLLTYTSSPFFYSLSSLPLLTYTFSPFSYSLMSLPLLTITSSPFSYSLVTTSSPLYLFSLL